MTHGMANIVGVALNGSNDKTTRSSVQSCLQVGVPKIWSYPSLSPTYKKGNVRDSKNYQTIIVGVVLRKVYATTLEN